MKNIEQEWHDAQADIERNKSRGFEDGLDGVPPEQNDPDYREGFAEGRAEGRRVRIITE